MKKNILIGFLSFFIGITSCSTLYCTNRDVSAKGRLEEVHAVRTEPNCLIMCFQSCCGCKKDTAERVAGVASKIGSGINTIMDKFSPPGILQIYLLCKNAAYYAAEGVMMILQKNDLLDGDGKLKPDAKTLFLDRIGWEQDEETRFAKGVEDLQLRFPKIIECLRRAHRGASVTRDNVYSISGMITSKLYSEYELIKSPTQISHDEIEKILRVADHLTEPF